MIKVAIKLLMIGLSLSNVLLLECMHVQGPANPANQELINAAENGNLEGVEAALSAGVDVNYADVHGNTALILAAAYGHTEMVRLLIEHGADVNRANNYGNTALTWAALYGYTEIARVLIEHGARIPTGEHLQRFALQLRARQVLSAVFEGNELAYAAARGDTKRVVELLSTLPQAQPLTINHQDGHGMTALHWAAAQGHDDIIKLLLEFGANINLQNAQGDTPLHLAARNGNLSTVRLLLARGANVTMVNRQGQTPLVLAQQYHRSAIVDLLARQAGRAVFGRVSRAGRAGEFAWQPTPTGATLPPEIADIIAQFAQAPGHMPPSGSSS